MIDLPTYPKGVLSLSLLSVAACLKNDFEVGIIDFNIEDFNLNDLMKEECVLVGMKVSSQNSGIAIELTKQIKSKDKSIQVVWGGEYPTLMPEECLHYADSVFSGLFEPISAQFISDLKGGGLKRKYSSEASYSMDVIPAPDFTFVKYIDKYSSFMGLPLETSRGCTEKCSFCMVHVMQKKNYYLKSQEQMKREISSYDGQFINIVDYNFGVDRQHVFEVSEIIKKSAALGWMAEMCIEFLDDDELLAIMAASRCKMIYCGLESVDDLALQSVHKMNTNHIENYERIIRKVQSHGIQIAAGLILGISNTSENTFGSTLDFFQRMGLIYVKLTFLTYNPGTKVQKYMQKKGTFITDHVEEFDGVRMSYLPLGVKKEIVISGAEHFIKKFYSLPSIIQRSFNTKLNFKARIEFVLFSLCYGSVYRDWLKNGFLIRPERFNALLNEKFKKPILIALSEIIILAMRKSILNAQI